MSFRYFLLKMCSPSAADWQSPQFPFTICDSPPTFLAAHAPPPAPPPILSAQPRRHDDDLGFCLQQQQCQRCCGARRRPADDNSTNRYERNVTRVRMRGSSAGEIYLLKTVIHTFLILTALLLLRKSWDLWSHSKRYNEARNNLFIFGDNQGKFPTILRGVTHGALASVIFSRRLSLAAGCW